MEVTLLNDWYMSTDSSIGEWSVLLHDPSEEQISNANIIRSFFINLGWTINAICGMLGCLQGESKINPAFIQATNRWRLPHSASELEYVPNDVMKNFYKEYYTATKKAFAIGLAQWDGYSTSPVGYGDRQKLVAFAIRNNIQWYDGWTQLYRIKGEQNSDETEGKTDFFKPVRYDGITYTFTNFPYSEASPETLAKAWTSGYERNAGGVGYRDDNARWWYDFFTSEDAPAIIPPEDFSLPLPADSSLPPFNPLHPVPPEEEGKDYEPIWLWCLLFNKRKETGIKCLKI